MIKKYASAADDDNTDILANPAYICASSEIITNALKHGSDVMQLPNGEIIITEYKATTVHYLWDDEKKKITRKIKNFQSISMDKTEPVT